MSEDKGRSTGMEDVQISLEHEWEKRNWMQWLPRPRQGRADARGGERGGKRRRVVAGEGGRGRGARHAVESIGADPDNVRRFLRQAR